MERKVVFGGNNLILYRNLYEIIHEKLGFMNEDYKIEKYVWYCKRRIIIIIFWGEKEKMNIGYVIYIYIYIKYWN